MEPGLAVALLGGGAHVVAVVERGEVQVEEACQRARDAAHEPHPKRPADSVVVRLWQPLAVLPGHEPDEEQRRQVHECCRDIGTHSEPSLQGKTKVQLKIRLRTDLYTIKDNNQIPLCSIVPGKIKQTASMYLAT